MPLERKIRGDVNVILNGLVRDGVIAGFGTDFGPEKRPTQKVQITVFAGTAMNDAAVRKAVIHALNRFADRVSVTVAAG